MEKALNRSIPGISSIRSGARQGLFGLTDLSCFKSKSGTHGRPPVGPFGRPVSPFLQERMANLQCLKCLAGSFFSAFGSNGPLKSDQEVLELVREGLIDRLALVQIDRGCTMVQKISKRTKHYWCCYWCCYCLLLSIAFIVYPIVYCIVYC